jgi:small ligand-binding sensory domain FIST
MTPFSLAHGRGADWRHVLRGLGMPGHGLGFVYLTDSLADEAADILAALRGETGVQDWIGTVGTGVLATGTEYQDEPAIVAMVADVDAFTVFSGRAPLKASTVAHFGIIHADPEAPDVAGLVSDMSAKITTGYLVGGISSSRGRTVQIANEVLSGGLSGAVLASDTAVATRLTQGCTPFPGRFRVTKCEDNIVARLDGRPALDVLREVVGSEWTALLVGIAVPGSDAGDYTARNLIGIDPRSKLIAIGDVLEPGAEILFCRRDAAAARADLARVAAELKAWAPAPRGALYYPCVARGEHLFGSRGAELQQVRQVLGDVPLVGFFCNGEISRDRLYGYSGVLTVFQ